MGKLFHFGCFAFATTLLFQSGVSRADDALSPELQQLLNTSVVQLSSMKGIEQSEHNKEEFSSSKSLSKASKSPASIYTVTADDIRQSGATNIPDALRIVPGVQVAQIGSSKWAVSIRGFNDSFSNKLLVMIDGRSVYNGIEAGVYWDTKDVMLEDISRIEVVKGPGGTMWGANAVNGVINIITKKVKSTQGAYVGATIGSLGQNILETRYGGKVNDDLYYKVYAKFTNHGESYAAEAGDPYKQTIPGDALDDSRIGRFGFKTEWNKSAQDNITVSGDIYVGELGLIGYTPLPAAPFVNEHALDDEVKGYNMVAQWDREISDRSSFTLKSYYDYEARDMTTLEFGARTFDIDGQYSIAVNDVHTLSMGAGFRYMTDTSADDTIAILVPSKSSHPIYSTFIQDKIALKPDELYFTIGSKFSRNDFSHFEWQPSARIAWYPEPNKTLWAAVSRAVRTPDRLINEAGNSIFGIAKVNGTPVALVRYRGPQDLKSEALWAYEAGYKVQATSDLSFDTSVFYNRYDHLVILMTNGSALSLTEHNTGSADSWGTEFVTKWQATERLGLEAGYTFFKMHMNDNFSQGGLNQPGKSPNNQVSLRANVDLGHNVEWNTSYYFVDNLTDKSSAAEKVEAYHKIDTRIGWKPNKNLELSVIGQNLLDEKHKEFRANLHETSTQIGRSVLANIKWSF